MADALISCPGCGTPIIQDYGDRRKLRSPILIFDGAGCTAKCSKCKRNVQLPVALNIPLPKKRERVRFVVKKD